MVESEPKKGNFYKTKLKSLLLTSDYPPLKEVYLGTIGKEVETLFINEQKEYWLTIRWRMSSVMNQQGAIFFIVNR
ncbi:MAG: hypothetical protein V3U15_04395 [Nitrospinota bacterium]